ncbi:MAG: hypothetical protein WBG43_04925 [Marinifilaceae bacterium]|jgi:hypothetical protein
MPSISLSKTQLALLDRDMNGLEILFPIQIFSIADEIESKIRLPKLPTNERYKVICKIIKRIDRAMYQYIPNEYYELINTEKKGIKIQEVEVIRQRLSAVLIESSHIPILTEYDEEQFIKIIVDRVTEAMLEGRKLE